MELLVINVAWFAIPSLVVVYILVKKRVHLSTAIVVFLCASLLLGLNVVPLRSRHFGFPIPIDLAKPESTLAGLLLLPIDAFFCSYALLAIASFLERRNKDTKDGKRD